jgi:hypothetical protein
MRLVRFRLVKCGLHWFENIASKAHPQTLFRRGLNGHSKVTEMFLLFAFTGLDCDAYENDAHGTGQFWIR